MVKSGRGGVLGGQLYSQASASYSLGTETSGGQEDPYLAEARAGRSEVLLLEFLAFFRGSRLPPSFCPML